MKFGKHFNEVMWWISFCFLAASYCTEDLISVIIWLSMMWYWYDIDKRDQALQTEEKEE